MKFKKGDKVKIPTQKTVGVPLTHATAVIEANKLNQDFLYVFHVGEHRIISVSADVDKNDSIFHQNDLELYEEKQIIGYKLIKPEYKEAALKITPSTYLESGISGISKKDYISVDFGNTYNLLKDAGVIDLWFEPVYKNQEPEEVIIEVGNPKKPIVISSKGRISFDSNIIPFTDVISLSQQFSVGGIVGFHSVNIEKIWIGCKSEGTEITKGDVEKVISEFNRLNNK